MVKVQANVVFGLTGDGPIGKQERKMNMAIHGLINTVVLISQDFTEGIVSEIRYDEGKRHQALLGCILVSRTNQTRGNPAR